MSSRFLVGLDVGTGVVKAAVVQEERGRPRLIAVFRERSSGVRKGAVVELTEATTAISHVLSEVKKIAKPALKTVYVNVGTPQVKVQHSHGVVAVSRADGEIYTDDIERVVKSSQAVTMGPNRMVLHTVIREFVVDGVGDIADPLGLSGSRSTQYACGCVRAARAGVDSRRGTRGREDRRDGIYAARRRAFCAYENSA
jgi:cell division protein FtsA